MVGEVTEEQLDNGHSALLFRGWLGKRKGKTIKTFGARGTSFMRISQISNFSLVVFPKTDQAGTPRPGEGTTQLVHPLLFRGLQLELAAALLSAFPSVVIIEYVTTLR